MSYMYVEPCVIGVKVKLNIKVFPNEVTEISSI